MMYMPPYIVNLEALAPALKNCPVIGSERFYSYVGRHHLRDRIYNILEGAGEVTVDADTRKHALLEALKGPLDTARRQRKLTDKQHGVSLTLAKNTSGGFLMDTDVVKLDRDAAIGQLSGFYAERDTGLSLEALRRTHRLNPETSPTYARLVDEGCLVPAGIDVAAILEERFGAMEDRQLEAIYGNVEKRDPDMLR
ncbi:MAG: hypothetical protein JSV63_00290 [Candidatus Aenigmatarchaeota archaeon]|nr:MAG: hypothetical protein JSV63_00290 [Candidatus Aenigmarchaeota archaeon]